jgi:hypothetical protein
VFWSADGKFLYISMQRESRTTTGKTVAIPIPEGEMFPNLPASGIQGLDHAAGFPGARVIDRWGVLPGPDPSVFAYVKMTVHRNLLIQNACNVLSGAVDRSLKIMGTAPWGGKYAR